MEGLARSLSVSRDRKADGTGDGKAAAALRSLGMMWGKRSETFAAVAREVIAPLSWRSWIG
jgi:hypothetical protein